MHEVITAFHRLNYNSWYHLEKGTRDPSWMGARTLKCPHDLWVYQETLFELKPDLVIEMIYQQSALRRLSLRLKRRFGRDRQ